MLLFKVYYYTVVSDIDKGLQSELKKLTIT